MEDCITMKTCTNHRVDFRPLKEEESSNGKKLWDEA